MKAISNVEIIEEFYGSVLHIAPQNVPEMKTNIKFATASQTGNLPQNIAFRTFLLIGDVLSENRAGCFLTEGDISSLNIGYDNIQASYVFLAFLQRYSELLEEKNMQGVAEIKALLARLTCGLNFANELFKISPSATESIKKNPEILQALYALIVSLKPGQGIAIPGGYDRKDGGGHAVIYEIELQANWLFSFKIITRGEGALSSVLHGTSPSGIIKDAPLLKLCNSKVIDILANNTRYQNMEEIKTAFCDHFKKSFSSDSKIRAKKQKSEICSIDCLLSWLQIHLKNSKIEHLFDDIKEKFLREHVNKLREAFLRITSQRKKADTEDFSSLELDTVSRLLLDAYAVLQRLTEQREEARRTHLSNQLETLQREFC